LLVFSYFIFLLSYGFVEEMRRGLKRRFMLSSNFLCWIVKSCVATKHAKATTLIGATPNQEVEGMAEAIEEIIVEGNG
jgi:hypothetical protein